MPSDFPVPRSALPSCRVSHDEYALRKQQAEQLLQHALQAFDEFADRNRYQLDTRRWKQDAAKDRLKVLKERKQAAAAKRAYMVVGETSGRVEDALYALSCESHAEHALLAQFLFDDVVDARLLRVLETARDDDPYRSLAYKWFVRQSSSGKARDVVYVEFSGTTHTRQGREIGFHVLHSLELAAFPDFCGCTRTPPGESIRTLFRQINDSTVEVFMLADLDASSGRGLLRSASSSSPSLFSPDALLAIAGNAVRCGEAKRLTMLIEECRRLRAQQLRQPSLITYHEEAVLCSMCRQEKKVFNSVSLSDCEVCSATICNKCRENRRIFVFEQGASTGRFEKVTCCQTCAFNAARIRPETPAWAAAKRESSSTTGSGEHPTGHAQGVVSTTHLQMRSASVASTVTSTVTSSSALSSAFPLDGDDDLLGHSLARLSLDSTADMNSRVSVDSVDCIHFADVEKLGSVGSAPPVPRPAPASHGATPEAQAHQMQLYLRMQQLTQLAEQTYHTTKQQAPPSSQRRATASRHP